MLNITEKEECCGCSACVQICPQECISLKEDQEGFWYPRVAKQSCTECGLCEKTCPILNLPEQRTGKPDAYAAFSPEDSIRIKSSSGGLFTLLAEDILQKGGVVFGAAFDQDWSVHHIKVETIEQLDKLRGSKYLQSRPEDTYREAEKLLREDRLVLYTGTGCQIAGLKAFLSHRKHHFGKDLMDNNNLYTVDVLCHGVPSPKVWKKYISSHISDFGEPIRQTFFRKKEPGWKRYSVSLCSDSKQYVQAFQEDAYMQMFLKNICLRPSCHNCHFKDLNRTSDITLGDFWGIEKVAPEMDDDKGTSIVLIQSNKGRQLFQNVMKRLKVKKVDAEQALPSSADSRCSVARHPKRNHFFEKLETNSMEELARLLKPSFWQRIKGKSKRLLIKLFMKG